MTSMIKDMNFTQDGRISGGASAMSPEVAELIGKAVSDWLSEPGYVAISYVDDPHARDLFFGLSEGIRLQGRDVVRRGIIADGDDELSPLPDGAAGTVAITHDAGRKVYTIAVQDTALDTDITESMQDLRQRLIEQNFVPALHMGKVREI